MEENNDTGCDPMENGMFKMIPSGDIVDFQERCRRLPMIAINKNRSDLLIGSKTAWQVELMQGGKLKRME